MNLTASLADIVTRRVARQVKLVALAVAMAARAWERRDMRGLASLLTILQHDIADSVTPVIVETLAAQGVTVEPVAAIVPVKMAGWTAAGIPLADSLASLDNYPALLRATVTELADTERIASQVAAVAAPVIDGYVRYLTPPSCARCTVLAGRFYRWSKPDPERVYRWGDGSSPTTKPDGFPRHPNCDCVMVYCTDDPPPGLIGDPMEAFNSGQVTGMSKADIAAVQHGAKLSRVVNVREKKAGLTVAGRVLDRGGRLTPEAIFQFAEDRDDIIALLTKAGYLTPLR